MFSFLPGVPHDLRDLARRIDTARHHGVPRGVILEFGLQSVPPETAGFDPVRFVTGAGRPMLLRDAVAAIHRAAEDDRVAGLISRVQLSAAPAAAVQELREAIVEFTRHKPSLAWAETYPGTLSYYLASAFGEVWMQPSGTVGLIGFATNALFLRDALDKAGVEAQFVARGEYKSAANLFTQDRYTEAHREADSRLIGSLHAQVWSGIAESRGIDADALDALADRAPLLRDDAVDAQLLDRIGFRDEAYLRIAELSGATDIKSADDDDAPPRLFLSRYAQSRTGARSIPGRESKPTIAVVTVAGPIVSGRGGPQVLPLSRSSAGGDTIAAALREAAADDDVKAVVLRVDSPGGSVTASETIWREVSRVRESGKPVVASMGAVAASGGYYISMAADTIVADPGTITGSIGVVEAEADLFYDDFVRRVAAARGMTIEQVDVVARGRVWTGADALDHGLVDELGGLRAAVRRAKALAGLDPDDEVRLASYPGSSVRDYLRPRTSSQPAAASLGEAVATVAGGAVQAAIAQGERSLTGASALWLGDSRF